MAGHGKFFVGGNWKCNGSTAMIKELVGELNAADVPKDDNVEIIVAPTLLHIELVKTLIHAPYQVAAQNCWQAPCGAFTGEVGPEMLKDIDIHWVILGHSERRHIIGESDAHIGEKIKQAITSGLKVIACIGETEKERDAGQAFDVVDRQMAAISKVVESSQWDKVVIAYEPVWAIGTGKVATPDIAQEV
ncbi:hypothetical protein WJX84_009098 [Apatococcus fuscideae]|uniref:Triosephosphate isomerase n=1 Tax=Apatococcus fuscideae TaxID=2026836 RepID=A0AAW1TJM3_9CHLO